MTVSFLLSAAAAISTLLGDQPQPGSTSNPPPANAGSTAPSPQPLEGFTRFIGGRWKMTTTAGRDTFDTWYWGPGKQSIRSMRLGTLTEGGPWSAMTVYYWHPAFKEIRLLSVGSVWRGVGEGKISFEGDSAEGLFTLHQTRGESNRPAGPRQLRERWTFAGPDSYHDDLSEKAGGEYELLVGWDRHRVDTVEPAERVSVPLLASGSTPSELMRLLERVLGHVWTSIAAAGPDAPPLEDEPRTRTSFEYVPHTDAIHGRIETINAGGSPSHTMDLYLYHHTGAQTLRCLLLASEKPNEAAVYEGDIVPADDGTTITIRLTEQRATGQQMFEARVEFGEGNAVRVQAWKLGDQQRTLVLDRRLGRSQ